MTSAPGLRLERFSVINLFMFLLKLDPAIKNTCVIHLFLFNPESNFVIGISPS